MSYLLLLPSLFAVYFWARRCELSGSYFATVCLLLTVVLSNAQWFVPGADTLVAVCMTMCLINLAQWYIEREFSRAIEAGQIEVSQPPPQTRFCSLSNHDFAVASANFQKPVELINARSWDSLLQYFSSLSPAQRQGMYASFNYSSISLPAIQRFVEAYPKNPDANILYGHVKLCEAKQHGLVAGVMPEENAAAALACAFKHFRVAQRLDADDPEVLCGLIITKGCIALKDEQIEASLVDLLKKDALHLHGVMSAARFLVKSPEKANEFVKLVETHSKHQLTPAVAGLMAHVECSNFVADKNVNAAVVADMYRQLKVFHKHDNTLGQWQRAICSNVIAFAFEQIGDTGESSRRLDELNGQSSPYPWRREHWQSSGGRSATLLF